MNTMSHNKAYYYSKPVLDEFMLKPTIYSVFLYLFQCYLNDIKIDTICCLNIAIIFLTKYVNDRKFLFNTDSLDRKDLQVPVHMM